MNMELNKVFAALLVAGLLAMGAGFISEALVPIHPAEASPSDVAPAVAEAASPTQIALNTAAQPAAATAGAAPAAAATFDGEKVFAKCKACHTADKGGKNRIGPNLHGIVGKAKATAEGFTYSDAMKKFGGSWSESELDQYLANPRTFIPGNKMTFAGLKTPEERAALIEWLKQQQ